MKKICEKLLVLIIVAANCIGIMAGCGASISSITTISGNPAVKDRLEQIKEKGVLTVASADNKPFGYIDPQTNQFTGIDADIITEIARRLGIDKVEMKLVPFKYLLNELNSDNDIDIIASGLYVTEERKKEVLFTNVWYKEPEAIVTLKASEFNFKEDLKNAVVGAESGTVFVELIQKWKNDGSVKDVRIYQSQPDLILAVATNEIDASILDSASASYLVSRYKNLNFKIFTPYKPELPGIVAAAVKKSDTSFADAINKKIDEMKEDGTLIEILKKHGLNESNFVSVKDGHISGQ
ncbi:basic amino acid ABC transporter substrate-binding protein [Clostridium gelidum]|uniref:Basic amino acid ABC transporter substrate-binding protein n=1 Tax=Clostridium gelidum TaxID=704125 RepID=A0ABM7T2D8_9CLOT|nr:ABC transporter substrate-binding protein [Clostridium gelidum]BCZ45403.1 basic amino acid ABC transporter substrate-binding protein [Clostridium gelidum]